MSILMNEGVKRLRAKLLSGESAPKLAATKLVPFSLKQPRLINAFSLGCDPEFVLLSRSYDAYGEATWSVVSAQGIGLRVDEAFGCDGAGTPVELRAHPSRFAVEVVGSLLNTLRWLYISNGSARRCNFWGAGSYVHRHSLGGHVHFGRKAGERAKEVAALDTICKAFEKIDCFKGSADRRKAGHYGGFGDYRKQAWGYEYRSFGCFLFNPALAHLLLTLSKLAVLDPEVCWNISKGTKESSDAARESIQKTLSFYRYLDDDASIAFRGLERTFRNRAGNTNILDSWGLGSGLISRDSRLTMIPYTPSTIPADKLAVEEVVKFIVAGAAIPARTPEVTWRGLVVPPQAGADVFAIEPGEDFYLGERELMHGLYGVKGSNLKVAPMRSNYSDKALELSPDFNRLLTDKENFRLLELLDSIGVRRLFKTPRESKLEIGLGRGLRQGLQLRAIKHFFEGGTLPLASSAVATPEWCKMWQGRLKRAGLFQL